jgi:organic radical activating enzyme
MKQALLSKWDHNRANIFDNKVLRVNWHLGNTCTYKCSYCDPKLNSGDKPWVNIAAAKKIVDDIVAVYREKYNKSIFIFELTGGEPTVYPGIEELCNHMKSLGIYVQLCTNGSRTVRWWEENAKNFTSITNSYHVEFTDVKHLTAVCNTVLDQNVTANVLVLLDPLHFDKVKNDIEYMKEFGNFGIAVRRVYDRNPFITRSYEYTPEQLDYLNDNVIIKEKISVEFPQEMRYRTIMIKDETSLNVNENAMFDTKDNDFLGWDCYAGIDTLSLDVTGNILPAYCYTGQKKTIGNWLTDDLSTLIWPIGPLKCGDLKCVCVHDLRARKIKI